MNSLTFFERATLANQFRILSFLDNVNSESYLTDAEIIENGFTGLYFEALQNIHSKEISSDICREANDILTMFRYISNAIERLTPEEKSNLDLNKILFDGFDANHDDHYYLAKFMIEKQSKYAELNNTVINSHSVASLIRYRKMLPVYKNIINDNYTLDFGINELRQFIEAVN
jgi:uncharacterized protein YfbU (UPF0304 family)